MLFVVEGNMFKILVLSIVITGMTVSVFAEPFAPELLRLSAPFICNYKFDGEPLPIKIHVSGASGTLVFGVFTRAIGEILEPNRNGYLGWHYIHKIDTCVYISEQISFETGNNTLVWDGRDNDGNPVPMGEYDYHIFAVDTVNEPEKCITGINKYYNGAGFIEEYQPDGTPYVIPVWTNYPDVVDINNTSYKLRKKWLIGNDPNDTGLMESCYYSAAEADIHYIAWAPDNHDNFFQGGYNGTNTGIIRKWKWIANGEAVPVTDWGDNGAYEYYVDEEDATWTVDTDGSDYLFALNQGYHKTHPYSELIVIDAEKAEEVRRFDLQDFYVKPEDAEKGGWINGGPTMTMFRNGYLFTNCHHSCTHLMLDPYADNDTDPVKWANQNGDYVLDHNFTEDAERPWVCNEPKVQQIIVDFEADDNLWCVAPIYDTGGAQVTFGLLAPDGTGVGNFVLPGENGGRKLGGMIIDSGCPYDGICFTLSEIDFQFEDDLYWVGHDSVKGIICFMPNVNEKAPVEFSVSQNVPNPFNPSTTISFILPEAKHVYIAVYNTTGQKVDTLADGFMMSGNHSVVWDGSDFSAGVYFCTVTVGKIARTVKMTLVK